MFVRLQMNKSKVVVEYRYQESLSSRVVEIKNREQEENKARKLVRWVASVDAEWFPINHHSHISGPADRDGDDDSMKKDTLQNFR
ncbi:hypothetical protein VTJ04DRAFT_8280 [Mycothermus thermophilus]|uniref:uncharacterized protein n=1 Tax=Humicola insolens TaxID=85995 RepID=UPI0037435CDC